MAAKISQGDQIIRARRHRMPNQTGPPRRARRASPTQQPSRSQKPRRRRAEHIALTARASCGARGRRRALTLLFVALTLALLSPLSPISPTGASTPATYWAKNAPFAGHDAARSSAVDVALTDPALEVLWTQDGDEPYLAGAVMDESRIYAVDRAGLVTARTRSTGALEWSHELAEKVAATPAIATGWLYVATLDGNLVALESQSGTEMGKVKLSGAARAATLVTEGRVFQGTDKGTLHVLDSSSLTEIWSFDTATISFANGTVSKEDTKLRAEIRSPPSVHEGNVFISAWNGRVYGLSIYGNEHGNPETLRWTNTVGDAVQAAPVVDRQNDRVIVPTKDGRLVAYSTTTGTTVWQSTASAAFIAGVAMDEKQIIVRTSDAELVSLNATSGAKQWSRLDPSGHLAAPVLARDAIVQASGNGTLSLLSRTTGKVLSHPETTDKTARWSLPGAVHAAPAVTLDSMAIVDHSGTLTVLGPPPTWQTDLKAEAVSVVAQVDPTELVLELGVRNTGPDPAPGIHVRVERNGVLHMERALPALGVDESTSLEFNFSSVPGDHELVITFQPSGATDPDPDSARVTRTITLLDPDEPVVQQPVDQEPPAAPTGGPSFGSGLATGLAWAAVPGTLAGIAGGVVLARRMRGLPKGGGAAAS